MPNFAGLNAKISMPGLLNPLNDRAEYRSNRLSN